MSKFRQSTITTAGKQVLFGDGTVTYTKAVLYSQDLSQMDSDQLKALTSLTGELKTTPLGIKDNTGNTVIVSASFTNAGLKEDIDFKSVGWFAKTGDAETLIAVSPVDGTATLGAGSPDGTSTDAVSLSMSMAIGDATTVNVVVNPAGTVSPSDLENAFKANEDKLLGKFFTLEQETELEDAIVDNYYDKSTIDEKLADKADKTAIDYEVSEINKQVDTKANSSDLDDYEKSSDLVEQLKSYATTDAVTKALATKADQSYVEELLTDYTDRDELRKLLDAKVDDTTWNETVAELQSIIDSKIDTVNKAVETKANSADTYSKAELDKKLLAISTDTDGKVNADQVAKMIADKADSADVYDKKDIDDKLTVKVDKTALDAEIAKIQASVDTKATKADVDSEITSLTKDKANTADVNKSLDGKADKSTTYTKTEVNSIVDGLAPSITDASNQAKHAQDSADTAQTTANNSNDEISKINGSDVVNGAVDVNTLTGEPNKVHVYRCINSDNQNTPNWIGDKRGNLIVINYDDNAKTQFWVPVGSGNDKQFGMRYWEGNNVSSWNQLSTTDYVNSKTTGTIITAYDIAGKSPTKETNSYTARWLVDQGVLSQFADQINELKGRRTVNAPDFNALTDSGAYYVTNPNQGQNQPTGSWGVLFVANGNGARISQRYVADNGGTVFERDANGGDWHGWNQIAWKQDVNSKVDKSQVNVATTLFRHIQNSNSWNDIFGVENPNDVLASIRIDAGGSGPLLNNYAAGIGFGGADTKGVLSVDYGDHQARITGGNGGGPVWSEDIAWKSDVSNLQNQINTLKTQLNDAVNTINYLKQNMVIGRHFSNEQQAQDWYNANQNGIAFVDK